MRVSALVTVAILIANSAIPQSTISVLPQSASPPETKTDGTQSIDGNATWVEVPEELQRAFDLMKQPGLHPELLEFFDITDSVKDPIGTPAPAPAMQTWHWIWIGVAIGVAVVILVVACSINTNETGSCF